LDASTPATLSKKILTGLLRRAMGFQGVIITDALEMKAISAHQATEQAALKAFQAGADILLFCQDIDAARRAIGLFEQAVKRGRLSEERVNDSLDRILRLKEQFLLGTKAPTLAGLRGIVGCEAHLRVVQRLLSP